jgi:CheY-like chemotaxis protein
MTKVSRRVSGSRILVAEDDPASLELVQVYLESRGYEVAVAVDGNRALDMGASGDFDLLILDVHMPMFGGQEVLQMLRKRPLSHSMKIMALTGDTRWALRDEMKRDGVDSYLIKPVSLAQLVAEVERLLTPTPPTGAAPPQRKD